LAEVCFVAKITAPTKCARAVESACSNGDIAGRIGAVSVVPAWAVRTDPVTSLALIDILVAISACVTHATIARIGTDAHKDVCIRVAAYATIFAWLFLGALVDINLTQIAFVARCVRAVAVESRLWN
jgi:hypothetical protein